MKRFRQVRNLSQAALAKNLGMSTQSVWYYESGTHWPKADVLEQIAGALGVRPWQLLAEEGEGGVAPPDLVEHIAAAARAAGLIVSRPE